MIKKMALCAVLILILVPAFAMAAGAQGSGSGTGQGSGLQSQQQTACETANQEQIRTCLQSQQQTASETANQEQIRTCLQQGNGTGQMLQNRICDQDGDKLRNMTRSTIQQAHASGDCQGTGYCGSMGTGNSLALTDINQTIQSQDRLSWQKRIMSGLESGTGSGDQIRDQVCDSVRNQTRLKDGSCGRSLNF